MPMRESAIEKYAVQQAGFLGGWAIKLDPTGVKGIPDRLVLLPNRPAFFLELKRPVGGRLDAAQIVWHEQLRARGFRVYVAPTKDAVDAALEEVRRSQPG